MKLFMNFMSMIEFDFEIARQDRKLDKSNGLKIRKPLSAFLSINSSFKSLQLIFIQSYILVLSGNHLFQIPGVPGPCLMQS